jgi:hypothetical protein
MLKDIGFWSVVALITAIALWLYPWAIALAVVMVILEPIKNNFVASFIGFWAVIMLGALLAHWAGWGSSPPTSYEGEDDPNPTCRYC